MDYWGQLQGGETDRVLDNLVWNRIAAYVANVFNCDRDATPKTNWPKIGSLRGRRSNSPLLAGGRIQLVVLP